MPWLPNAWITSQYHAGTSNLSLIHQLRLLIKNVNLNVACGDDFHSALKDTFKVHPANAKVLGTVRLQAYVLNIELQKYRLYRV